MSDETILIHLQAQDYTIPWANDAFKNRFGPIEGRKCFEILHDRNSPCAKCPTFLAFSNHQPVIREWVLSEEETYMTVVEPLPNEVPLLIEHMIEY
ncbi:MAG: hypothetical protein F3743_08680 [Nitrospinae bacterium]|nr:hypothetical protein [Nitrospinota bacterium]MZH05466.1 hypothetical protein [Nitrospinota bacterium]MZH13717.1 hypothetical protein [Nitrospinota bacterium]